MNIDFDGSVNIGNFLELLHLVANLGCDNLKEHQLRHNPCFSPQIWWKGHIIGF